MKSRIMYIEHKGDNLTGPAKMGLVKFSKTGSTVYYNNLSLKKFNGYKANFYDIESGDEYWISGPRKDGCDRLYCERVPVEVDKDIREEYWTIIRNLSKRKNDTSYFCTQR